MIRLRCGLFLGTSGDAATIHPDTGISHVLTVDSNEPPPLGDRRTMFVRALDDAAADLLSFLDDCVRFVQEALSAAGAAVLVHWYIDCFPLTPNTLLLYLFTLAITSYYSHAGVSRSATIVTAYMMKIDGLTFEEAYSKLQDIKPDVKINDEFVKQLKLYEKMGCNVDLTSADYKEYRLQKVISKYPELRNLPQELFALDPVSLEKTDEVLYRCRKCRRSLFRGSSTLSHVPGSGPNAFAHKRISQTQREGQTKCTSYFIEPVQWMEPALLGVLDGQLLCPKCGSKLGSFNWYGDQCSCGRWVTPAFQIHKNRVDEVKHLSFCSVKNVSS
ncbi:dual specificity protein phosphatase 12 isoform X1 [Stegostoma tigrinum]|uniref:dual specificity protein phosphatase 12 isoform X1 n=1 Tax=Stegostoma tigrinum TaxID=3053191 RepID=UPI00287016E3|nr:dual specificity protein phosphatase 12 isoform X1 [Stegostoma tigrinum]